MRGRRSGGYVKRMRRAKEIGWVCEEDEGIKGDQVGM